MASSFSLVYSVLEKAGLLQYMELFRSYDIDDQAFRMLPKASKNSPEMYLFIKIVPFLAHRIQILEVLRLTEAYNNDIIKARGGAVQNRHTNGSATAVAGSSSGVIDLTTNHNYNGFSSNNEDYQRVKSNRDSVVIETCHICQVVLNCSFEGNGIKLQNCRHTFCRNCLANHITRSYVFCTRCPAFTNQTQCTESVVMHEIASVLSNEDFMRYCSMNTSAKQSNSTVNGVHNQLPREIEKTPDELLLFSILNELPNSNLHVPPNSQAASDSDFGSTRSTVANIANNARRVNSRASKRSYSSTISNSQDTAVVPNANYDLLLNSEMTQCSFCTAILKPRKGIQLQMCSHVYCRNCLIAKIRYSEGLQVKCNITTEVSASCCGFLLESEIKSIAPPDVYSEYTKKSSQQALKGMNFYKCNKIGCMAQFELEEGSQRKGFLCPACQSVNCIPCNAIHEGLDCERYLKILCDAIHAGIDVNGNEFSAMVEKEKLQGFDHICDNINKLASPNAAHEKRPRISYDETMHIMENMHFIPTSKKFECFICANEEVQEGIVLQDCLHTFCKECLVQVVRHSEDPEVKCPLDTCKSMISTREIQAVVPPDLFETFLSRSTNLAEKIIPNTFHCLTKDCIGWCIADETATKFCCPVCFKVSCLLCKEMHDELTCQEFEEKLAADNVNRQVQKENEQKGEQAVQKLVSNRTYMRCPKCKMVCQKINGCNHVTCGSCKKPFIWKGK